MTETVYILGAEVDILITDEVMEPRDLYPTHIRMVVDGIESTYDLHDEDAMETRDLFELIDDHGEDKDCVVCNTGLKAEAWWRYRHRPWDRYSVKRRTGENWVYL